MPLIACVSCLLLNVLLVRPDNQAVVDFNGQKWTVSESSENNPKVKLTNVSTKKVSTLNWKTDKFTIERKNTENDFDMRASNDENAAKEKALEMMKNYINAHGGTTTGQKMELKNVTVASFTASAQHPMAEWSRMWEQKTGMVRTWKLVIDMDRPLESSTQEPHVGWTLSATSTKSGNEVKNVFGHVWLKTVSASRQ